MLLDKSKIKHDAIYMRRGGNQLIEIMEREFPLEYIVQNAHDICYQRDLQGLEIWIKNNTNMNKTKKECTLEIEGYNGKTYKSCFFTPNTIKRILTALYQRIDILPQFNANDEIINKYSFMEYTVVDIKDTLYRAIFPKVNRSKFAMRVHKYLKKRLERVIVLEWKDGAWVEVNNKWARDYKKSIKVMEKLSV